MSDEKKPLNPRPWGEYVTTGRGHFDRVQRSCKIFGHNTDELFVLLCDVESSELSAMRLMEASGTDDETGDRFRQEFSERLDQRLHNMISAAIALVDHTRPLVGFYPHEQRFSAEWATRSGAVADTPHAKFIRKFRNYLLHVGVAPVMQTMTFGVPGSLGEQGGFEIKLSAESLLRFSGWDQGHREYIRSFDEGPPLRSIVQLYGQEMIELYRWLLAQYPLLHPPGVPPPHLYQ